jgi:serine protease Do
VRLAPCALLAGVVLLLGGGPGIAAAEESAAQEVTARETATRPDPGVHLLSNLYRESSPAVVGVTARHDGDDYIGSGTVIDPVGLVLTALTVVPEGADSIRVYLQGGATVNARQVKAVAEKDFCLLRTEPPGSYPAISLGDSSAVRIGQLSVTLGNAFGSITEDDQVSFAAGLVSGRYSLSSVIGDARLQGQVLETTAPVNDYMDGGPLLDRDGRLVGLVTAHYARSRWLGTAVPINDLKPLFGDFRRWHSDRAHATPKYLGLELSEAGGGVPEARAVRIDAVYEHSPASLCGLEPGAIVRRVAGNEVDSLETFLETLEGISAGESLRLTISAAGRDPESSETLEVEVPIWAQF